MKEYEDFINGFEGTEELQNIYTKIEHNILKLNVVAPTDTFNLESSYAEYISKITEIFYEAGYNEANEKLKIATAMLTKGTYPSDNNNFDDHFIHKDKVREIIDTLKAVSENKEFGASYSDYEEAISKIENLLGGK